MGMYENIITINHKIIKMLHKINTQIMIPLVEIQRSFHVMY
jgi:hypothetical protein